jgi:hypothetical protein
MTSIHFGVLAFFPLIIFGFGGLLALLTTIFWIWMLVDCLRSQSHDTGSKVAWTLVILFTHIFGAILYFAFGRESR